jgi:hypothetical protein
MYLYSFMNWLVVSTQSPVIDKIGDVHLWLTRIAKYITGRGEDPDMRLLNRLNFAVQIQLLLLPL